jgi:predicted murein hydrolase (TIGR00659 family)
MTDEQRLYSIWVYLQAEPLFWLTLTIGAYLVGDFCYRRTRLFPLFNPVALGIIIVSVVLLAFGVQYERYFDGAKFIHFLLGPATVSLAIPIFRKWELIMANARAILTTVLLGSMFAILTTYALASMFALERDIVLSLLPRSVTAPIAMGVSEIIGGIPSLTAIITIVTGIIGAAFGTFTLDLLRIREMSARGFAIGLASHGIGTARAMSRNETAGVFAAVAMGLSGIVTALVVPVVVYLLRI